MLKRIVISIIILSNHLFAQTEKYETFGIGLQTSGTSSMTPNIAFGISLNYQCNKHQFYGAFDIYSPSFYSKSTNIPGYQLGYSYMLREPHKKFNVFLNCNLLYVQFAQGALWAIKYNYLPIDKDYSDINLWRIKSFANTFGVGINFKLLKVVKPFLVISGGYNYFQTKNSPTNYNGYSSRKEGASFVPSIQVKLGVTVDLFKNKKQTNN
jgi:hypothetical protein